MWCLISSLNFLLLQPAQPSFSYLSQLCWPQKYWSCVSDVSLGPVWVISSTTVISSTAVYMLRTLTSSSLPRLPLNFCVHIQLPTDDSHRLWLPQTRSGQNWTSTSSKTRSSYISTLVNTTITKHPTRSRDLSKTPLLSPIPHLDPFSQQLLSTNYCNGPLTGFTTSSHTFLWSIFYYAIKDFSKIKIWWC